MSNDKLAQSCDTIAKCNKIMGLIDVYVERPNAGNRLSIRTALLDLAAHEAEKQAVEHRPGCDALGGYGHGVGACNCGADEAKKQAVPVAVETIGDDWEGGYGSRVLPPSESDKEDAELTDSEILDAVYRDRRPFVDPAVKQGTIEHARRVLRAARAKKEQP
jgi:hypothetical protein